MPVLNYENAGALTDYEYLQGTITAIYPEDDTCDLAGLCGELSNVPLFYHCDNDVKARSNGALTGASAAFSVGDVVIVLKAIGEAKSSVYSQIKIELKGMRSSSSGSAYYVVGRYDGVVICGTIYFIVADIDCSESSNIYWHSVEGSRVRTEALSFSDPMWLSYDFFSDSSYVGPRGIVRLSLIGCRRNSNSIIIRVHADAPEGYEGYEDLFIVSRRIPIRTWVTESSQWLDEIGLNQPIISPSPWTKLPIPCPTKNDHVTENGWLLHREDDYADTLANGSESTTFYGSGMWDYQKEFGYDFVVSQFNDITYRPFLSNCKLKFVNCVCPSSWRNRILLAICVFDTSGFSRTGDRSIIEGVFIESYLAWWDIESIIGKKFTWMDDYEESTGGFLALANPIFGMTKDQFYQLKQIECYEDKIYVFSDSGEGKRLIPLEVLTYPVVPYEDELPDISQDARLDIYDYSGNLLESKVFTGKSYIDRVDRITYLSREVFCFRFKNTPFSGYSNMYFWDILTKEFVKEVELPEGPSGTCVIPQSDLMLNQVNALRAAEPLVELTGDPKFGYEYINRIVPVPYLGYSVRLSEIAKAHLNYCISTGKLTHKNVDGLLIVEYGPSIGVFHGADNMCMVPRTGLAEEVNTAVLGWAESPHHFGNMVYFYATTMGWAAVDVPLTLKTITVDAGLFTGSGYTEGETEVKLSGNNRFYMQIFATG